MNSRNNLVNESPKSAYIHVPFCKHRCGYCNFTLVAGRDDLVDAYLRCLEVELRNQLVQPRLVDTIFLGGGTPTHLSDKHLATLLELIQHWLPLSESGEYSCEANPLDCTHGKLGLLRDHGVNRISLGGQSFNDAKLSLLERDHTGGQLRTLVNKSAELFDNVSLDLIFAAPGETIEQWHHDVQTALDLPLKHLSTYGLTIEPGANFWGRMLRGDIAELDADLQLEMYNYTIDTLNAAGWQHYEVSNFSLPGAACRHNTAYWNGQCWWAFGPGASSFLPTVDERQPSLTDVTDKLDSKSPTWTRATNHRSTTQYIRLIQSGKSPVHERDELDLEQWIRERLVFGLRQMAGVDMVELSNSWPGNLDELFEPYLSRYQEHGWLEVSDGRLRLTRQGLVISDSLWPDLLVSTDVG